MTAYCSADDLNTVYGEEVIRQLADRDRDGVADADVLQYAADMAAGEIDGWLARRYAVPLATTAVPPRVKSCAVVLAFFYLHTGLPDGDPARIDYGNQLKWLQAVAKGEADLPGASPAAVSGGGAGASGAAFDGAARIFDRRSLRGL